MTEHRKKTLLVLGGTGQVGSKLIEAALANPLIEQVVAPTRRPLGERPRLINPLVDFATLPELESWWKADAAVCALGTSMKQAGSKEKFRQVDHDYVLTAATLAHKAGTPTFVLNSSVGANSDSRSFYLKVKGDIEESAAAIGFSSLTFVRPSLLDSGKRTDSRPGEMFGLWLARRLGAVVPAKYRPVTTAEVAECMLDAALAALPGVHSIESKNIPHIQRLARRDDAHL
jgi:uncharacterized protein YbjT (DUF2867 family)